MRFEAITSRLAFPDRDNLPAGLLQQGFVARVAFLISGEFRPPELRSRRGNLRNPASLVMVPETAVHEDGDPMPGQDDIWRPGKVTPMQPETIA